MTAGNGTYTLEVPNGSPVVVKVGPNRGLDADGAPVDKAGTTLLEFTVPTALPLNARLKTLALQFNVDYQGCATPAIGATNPAAPGTYGISSWVKAADGTTRVAREELVVDAAAPTGAALPSGCGAPPEAGGPTTGTPQPAAPVPVLKVKRSATKVRVGKRLAIRVRADVEPTTVTVLDGKRVLARLRDVDSAGVVFRYTPRRADRGRLVTLTFRPAKGKRVTANVRVIR